MKLINLRVRVAAVVAMMTIVAPLLRAQERAPGVVAATAMTHKVLAGYQGWFGCPGDGVNRGWRHWSRDGRRISPETVTVEMWPDMTEYGPDERYAAEGFTSPDGHGAELFSSVNPKTVRRHFDWMREYGIDGVFLQRFLVELKNPATARVLENVRASAEATGRVYAICYDLSGAPKDKVYDTLVADWRRLVDERKVTGDGRYLRHNGKPVVFVWGFYSDRFGGEVANRIIDFFKTDPKYGATLVGGCQWYWRREKDPEWARAFRRLDVISPWNVGNTMTVEGHKEAATAYWKDDLVEARRAGAAYLPVIYPGFAWTNLKGAAAARATIPRLGGEFFRRQFVTAAGLGIDMAYVAMFDEVDEGTAIFKVTNSPPKEGRFATYEGMAPEAYLKLTGEGARVVRGDKGVWAEGTAAEPAR
jgi:hypothetical protein